MVDNDAGGAAGSDGGGMGNGRGSAIFPSGMSLKGINSHTKTFTKKFYFKIYANDWVRSVAGTGSNAVTTLTHFATIIPYQALCMYLSPQEYMEVVRGSHYCRIVDTKLELKFKAIRTPFDANSTDAAEANGNLQFEIQRWDGLEHMLPFQVVDLEGRGTDSPVKHTSYAELIERLYGRQAFAHGGDAANFKWPATMRERGLSWRPIWKFSPNGQNNIPTVKVGMYREVNQYISSLPVGEYITDSMNTNVAKMSEGYCFNKVYKPVNGLISFNATAAYVADKDVGRTRINNKIRYEDAVQGRDTQPALGDAQYRSLFGSNVGSVVASDLSQATAPASNDVGNSGGLARTSQAPVQLPGQTLLNLNFIRNDQQDGVWNKVRQVNVPNASSVDGYGYGYNNEMQYYTIANLENYVFFNANRDAPIKHMPSMMIGIVPKTNIDNTIVNATAEFECTTSITISCDDTHPTYMNCSYSGGYDGYPAGYMDDYFNDQSLYGGRWQHNEINVALRDNKYWAGDYGIAGKPLFRVYDPTAPLFN